MQQKKFIGVKKMDHDGLDPNIVGDPKFDPEARKKKILALKVNLDFG